MHAWMGNASAHHTIRATAYRRADTFVGMADGVRGDVVRQRRLARGWRPERGGSSPPDKIAPTIEKRISGLAFDIRRCIMPPDDATHGAARRP